MNNHLLSDEMKIIILKIGVLLKENKNHIKKMKINKKKIFKVFIENLI